MDSTSHPYFHIDPALSHDGFISSTEASAHFGITNDYITRLCRGRKIEGVFIGRLWFVNKKTLENYLTQTRLKREEQHRLLSQQLRQQYHGHFAAPQL